QRFCVVDVDVAGYRFGTGDAVFAERPFSIAARMHENVGHAMVMIKIIRSKGLAVFSEILWRGAGHKTQMAQFSRDQARNGELADLHGDVDAFVREIDGAVAELCIDNQIRMLFQEARNHRHDDAPPESYRQMHAQASMWAGCGLA